MDLTHVPLQPQTRDICGIYTVTGDMCEYETDVFSLSVRSSVYGWDVTHGLSQFSSISFDYLYACKTTVIIENEIKSYHEKNVFSFIYQYLFLCGW